MTRRELLGGAAAALAATRLDAFKSRITKANISAITDEVSKTQAGAIEFAHQYGLQWVELRNLPETKKEFAFMPEAELKLRAAELASNHLKVSFLNTSLFKFMWPGTGALKPGDQERWDRRKDDVAKALTAANILGVDKVRVFTGTRVENPESTYPLIVRTMEELIPMAEKAKVHLLIENEYTQNIGTSAEVKAIMALLPSKTIGYNWDPENALHLKERAWPEGYSALPVNRMLNAQFKGKSVLADSAEWFDWKPILEAMQKDNYQLRIGLETHVPVERAPEAMQNMLRMVGELS